MKCSVNLKVIKELRSRESEVAGTIYINEKRVLNRSLSIVGKNAPTADIREVMGRIDTAVQAGMRAYMKELGV